MASGQVRRLDVVVCPWCAAEQKQKQLCILGVPIKTARRVLGKHTCEACGKVFEGIIEVTVWVTTARVKT